MKPATNKSVIHALTKSTLKFAELALSEPLLRAIASEGYTVATPIQARAIPPALEGRDVLGCAQTGTGKTAAFALPILHRLFPDGEGSHAKAGHAHAQSHAHAPAGRRARCLVLCPTRELAAQIADSFRAYGRNLPVRMAVVYGGVGERPQIDALARGVDVVVATPGRLLDLMGQGRCDLGGVEVLVLDEADRMLDMGFINDIRKIVARLPKERQTMLFSATMPAEIRALAEALLRQPVAVQVAPVATTAEGIEESVYFVDRRNKPELLAHLVGHLPMTRALVFTRTKHGADRVVRQLHRQGIRAEALHGNKTQSARKRALENFRSNRTALLVATDLASRGIDIDDITHVVNYDLTHEPETYVHRIGRTARAGATGSAVSFCDREERPNLEAIQKLIRRPIPVRTDHPTYSEAAAPAAGAARESRDARAAGPATPAAAPRHGGVKSAANAHPGTAHHGAGQHGPAHHGPAQANGAAHPRSQPQDRRHDNRRDAASRPRGSGPRSANHPNHPPRARRGPAQSRRRPSYRGG